MTDLTRSGGFINLDYHVKTLRMIILLILDQFCLIFSPKSVEIFDQIFVRDYIISTHPTHSLKNLTKFVT